MYEFLFRFLVFDILFDNKFRRTIPKPKRKPLSIQEWISIWILSAILIVRFLQGKLFADIANIIGVII